MISLLSQRTLLRSCILTLWLILSYLLLRFLLLTGRKKGITTQESENNKTHDVIVHYSHYIFKTLLETHNHDFFGSASELLPHQKSKIYLNILIFINLEFEIIWFFFFIFWPRLHSIFAWRRDFNKQYRIFERLILRQIFFSINSN